jgi:HEAT repeat protein
MTTPELLGCPDEVVRLRGVEELAREDPASAVPLLVRALADSSWRVRQAAVKALVRRDGTEAVGAVLRAMQASPLNLSILNSTIQILGQAGIDTLTELTEFLTGPDVDLRICAALTLGAQNNSHAVPALLQAMEDSDPNVRYHVIEALGRLRASAAVDALTAVAEVRDFTLAFPALDALASIGDSRIAYRLAPLLEDELLQSATVEALGCLGDEETAAPLAALLNTPTAPTNTVARALARLHDRFEAAYGKGSYVAGLARQAISTTGVQNLIDALDKADGADLQALALILGWPESPTLDRALTQLLGRAAARKEVIEAVVRKGPRMTDLLVEQLQADDLETREAAVLALGRIGAVRAVPALLQALSTDGELTIGVTGSLAMIGDLHAYFPLLGLIGHGDVAVRRAAVSALNSLGHPDMAADMVKLLGDPKPLVREAAVRIVGYAGYPECADLLLDRCHDQHENVRVAAVESLPCLEDRRVLSALASALQDEAVNVRAAATRALGQLGAPESWPLLQQGLADRAPWVRYYAARAVGRQGHTQALDALVKLAQGDAAMQVRVAAVEAIGNIGGASVLPLLVALVDANDADLARAAIAAIGASGCPEALPPLLAALGSHDSSKRFEAVRALGASGAREAVAALQRVAATDANSDLAEAAINALGQLPVPESLAALIELAALPGRRAACVAVLPDAAKGNLACIAGSLSHQQLDVRRAVVEALGRMRDPRATALLSVALEDAEGSVRLAALTALAHSANPQKGQRLTELAWHDPDLAVRRAAQAQLRR